MYYLVKVSDDVEQLEEICLKVFVFRDDFRFFFVYWIWKLVDF